MSLFILALRVANAASAGDVDFFNVSLLATNGEFRIDYDGQAGNTYYIERASDITSSWTPIGDAIPANFTGDISVTDNPPASDLYGFYRSHWSDAGSALSFNGGQWVEFTNGPSLGTNFTEEAWIFPQPTDSDYHGILGFGGSIEGGRAPSMWVANTYQLHGGFGTGDNWINWTTTNVLTLDRWNHIAATYDGAMYRVYVNGSEVKTLAATAIPITNAVAYIGRVDNGFQGRIDEVRIWNITRSAEQIHDNAFRIITNNEPGLLINFHFDEGAGTTTTDAALNHVTGELISDPAWTNSTVPASSF